MLQTNKFKKFLLCALLSLFILIPSISYGQALSEETGKDVYSQSDAFRSKGGFEATIEDVGVSQIIADVVEAFLGLLGIIFVILIILGGYNWMTAGGNEEKVTKAKETIRHAIIGLIIVVSAYAITYFVFSSLEI